MLSTHEEQGLRRVLPSSVPTASFEGQSNPGGRPAFRLVLCVWTRDCPCLEKSSDLPSTVKTFLDLGFPTSPGEDLPLCSSQICCFLSCPCPCCGLAAAVMLPHHFSGHRLVTLFLLLVSEYYFDQTSKQILDLGCWCLQPATCLYCSEISLPILFCARDPRWRYTNV